MLNKTEDTLEYAIDFKRLFSIVQRWAWLLILALALCAAFSYMYSRQQRPIYEATTSILVTRNSQQSIGDISQTLNLSELVQTYVRMLSLEEFLGIVSQRLGYEVKEENVNVTALSNTQVIRLQVQDEDPTRATRIADTMVVVLREQNETLQASRYAEAEQSLNLQIQDNEAKISEVQAQLDQAKTAALAQQIDEAKANIDTTVNAIKVTSADLEQITKLSWTEAHAQLSEQQKRLPELQALAARQSVEYASLHEKLSSDVQAQSDPKYAATLQAQIDDLKAQIGKTQQSIEETQSNIAFLTPLDTEQGYNAALVEKQNFLETQQSLLTSYQNVYTSLLSTGEVSRTTNEIDKLSQDLQLYQNIYLNLLSSREDVKRQKLQTIPTVEQISPSQTAKDPVRPRTLLNTILGGMAGLILALSFVILREMTDDTIKSSEEVEGLLGAKVIGYIMEMKNKRNGEGIFVKIAPRSPVAEAFRVLRANLEFSGREKPVKTIVVTSGGPADGKTTVIVNLATILSQSGKKVILVDADLRRPSVHRYVGISNAAGLSDLINGKKANVEDYVQKLEKIPNLSVLPSGALPSNPTDLLGSQKMKDLLSTLSNAYDYVVIDSSPMMVADPQVLLSQADAALLVLVPGQTRKEVVRAVREQIQHTGAPLLGVVFNRLQKSRRTGYGGYSYYAYPYYYSSNYYSSDNPNGNGTGKKKDLQNIGSQEKP
jgi:succinoglycan biosynthesis transport protein ExoP